MKDEILVNGRWQFDESVTAVFDEMLERSIPNYDVMRSLTTQLACKFAQPRTQIFDLGCSRGAALRPIIEELEDENFYVGVEVSAPMREAAIKEIGAKAKILDMDLRREFPSGTASVILSVLTLQFTPIEYRQRIMKRIYDALLPNGVFLFVEKVLGNTSEIDETLVDLYYDLKGEHGYTTTQINNKRESLEGVLVPVTAKWNEELLQSAGFREVDCYWRNLNFAAWVALK